MATKAKRRRGRERVAIYALVDPRDGAVRYVGKASSLRRRFKQHLRTPSDKRSRRASWLRSLRRQGLRPSMLILERCWSAAWKERERYWIARMRSEGYRLVNGTEGGDQPPAGLGAARKGHKQAPLQRMQRQIQGDLRWSRARGCPSADVHLESLERIRQAVQRLALRMGSQEAARQRINEGLVSRGW